MSAPASSMTRGPQRLRRGAAIRQKITMIAPAIEGRRDQRQGDLREHGDDFGRRRLPALQDRQDTRPLTFDQRIEPPVTNVWRADESPGAIAQLDLVVGQWKTGNRFLAGLRSHQTSRNRQHGIVQKGRLGSTKISGRTTASGNRHHNQSQPAASSSVTQPRGHISSPVVPDQSLMDSQGRCKPANGAEGITSDKHRSDGKPRSTCGWSAAWEIWEVCPGRDRHWFGLAKRSPRKNRSSVFDAHEA